MRSMLKTTTSLQNVVLYRKFGFKINRLLNIPWWKNWRSISGAQQGYICVESSQSTTVTPTTWRRDGTTVNGTEHPTLNFMSCVVRWNEQARWWIPGGPKGASNQRYQQDYTKEKPSKNTPVIVLRLTCCEINWPEAIGFRYIQCITRPCFLSPM